MMTQGCRLVSNTIWMRRSWDQPGLPARAFAYPGEGLAGVGKKIRGGKGLLDEEYEDLTRMESESASKPYMV